MGARSINEVNSVNLKFPIIADPTREIAKTYDMLDEQDLTNVDQKGIPFVRRPVWSGCAISISVLIPNCL